jgi:hypothetical protein
MFTVEYVDSVDPLVGLVQTDPGAIFAKPHMGYLLFLFGEADRETAEWIRRNLRALDSLLGLDIAGAVFVKSFEIRALVRRYYNPRYEVEKIRDGTIDIREIRQAESDALAIPMFDARRNPSMEASRSMEDLTATTYASDEVARSLGLLSKLPCIALLDALPGPIRCLPLDVDVLSNSLTLVRRIVGGLIAAPGYDASRHLLWEAHAAGQEICRLLQAIRDSERQQREVRSSLKNPLIGELRAAQARLIEGSARRFRHQLGQSSLPKDAVELGLERASKHASTLTHVCRTIRGVSWYVDAKWPLSDSDRNRLLAILSGHAAEILGVSAPASSGADETIVRERLAALEEVKVQIVTEIWGGLPRPDILEHEFKEAVARAMHESREERERLTAEARHISVELEKILQELGQAPRITDVFDAVMDRRNEEAAPEMEVGPEIMEKLLKAVTSGAVKFVGRDIYIGTNVAAMGPFASAEGTTFA